MEHLCECGCGKPTPPYRVTSRVRGAVKGEPSKYLHGHYQRANPAAEKACLQCGITFPHTADYFHRASKTNGCGLHPYCKRCSILRQKAYAERHAEQLKARAKEYRSRPSIKARRRAWRTQHRDEENERQRRWRENDHEHYREIMNGWAHRNHDKIRMERANKKAMRRITRNSKREWFPKSINLIAIFERHRGLCGICDQPVPMGDVTWDHILAITKGGLHMEDNLQPAHMRCNQIKGNRPLEWARERVQRLGIGTNVLPSP